MSFEHVKFLRQNQTVAERLLWTQLRAKRVGNVRFRRQHAIGPYTVDFYCHAAKLVIELDGESHDARIQQDNRRRALLRGYGAHVVRFPNREVIENLEGVVRSIAELVARLKPSPSPSQREGDRL